MDREPDAKDPGSSRPAVRVSRRVLAAGLVVIAALIAGLVVLAVRPGGPASPASAATPRPSPSATPSRPVSAIYQQARPSVVLVSTAAGTIGSGVIVADDGTIVTANHVIAGASKITVTFFDGTTAAASVAAADPKTDIAELTPAVLPQVVVPATLGGSAGVGAPVVAIGNPLGLTDSVSSGVVSGLNRTAQTAQGTYAGLIQFDASVNPGSSGGPLLDAQGNVVGIVVSIANPAREDAFAGIGFAVPIAAALGGGNGGPGPHVPPI